MTCSKCKVEKPEIDFNVCKSNKRGRRAACKVCVSTIYYKPKRQEVISRSRDWANKNPERRKENAARWYDENRDHIVAQRLDKQYGITPA